MAQNDSRRQPRPRQRIIRMMRLADYFHKQICPRKDRYVWLTHSLIAGDAQVEKFADFGCGDGVETLALMCALRASEGAGVDRDAWNIRNARDTVRNIKSMILAEGRRPDMPLFPGGASIRQVRFCQADIVEGTQLPSDYYDLAFCHSVLYHVWLDQGGADCTEKAIREMARVVRPGGLVAAREPTRRPDKWETAMDFQPLFDGVGLEPAHVKLIPLGAGEDMRLTYSKPGSK